MTHGRRNTPEYDIWRGMKKRCHLPTYQHYAVYGGRGISVCEEWRNSFQNFISDMGERPSALYSIDRYPNPNGNYEPGNCRWATDEEQNRNRDDYNVKVPLDGVMVTVAEWADATGGNRHMVYERISRFGWSPERAVSIPSGATKGKHVLSAAARASIAAKAVARGVARRALKAHVRVA